MAAEVKTADYAEVWENGRKKYECALCGRYFTTTRSTIYHLHTMHGKSPLKKIRKQYLENPSIEIPRSTLHYKKKKNDLCDKSLVRNNEIEKEKAQGSNKDVESVLTVNDYTLEDKQTDEQLQNISDDPKLPYENEHNTSSLEDKQTDEQLQNISDDPKLPYENEHNTSSDDSNTDVSTDTSDSSSDEIEDGLSDSSSIASSSTYDQDEHSDMEEQNVEMCLLSCFLRNNFSASSAKDVLCTLQRTFPECESLGKLSYEKLWGFLDVDFASEVHYCEKCYRIFPDNPDIDKCRECGGPRYKAGINRVKQACSTFVYANVERQLKNLLQSPGIWDDIKRNKSQILERHAANPDLITDITDGRIYKELLSEGGFLDHSCNITVLMNTDGLSLYSSSKIQLWPVFFAVNELSPSLRFARENVILAGIWQGKGKPPMQQYLGSLCCILNNLYDTGIIVDLDNEETCVKVKVIGGTYDLPAKAAVLNMTQFNGSESCIACEDPGKVVKQGKGHCRTFPFRENNDKYPQRNQGNVSFCMLHGTPNRRIKGFRGESALLKLKDFNIVSGSPPDYMHGTLLGVIKCLMNKWFSATESKSDCFVGNHLKIISKRMNSIQPPQFMERLPRDLEQNYIHFKATELQAWLLYYALPCLCGILPEIYLQHFALLSEGIYLLLGDHITDANLTRAERILVKFFKDFCNLYPAGNCGLNVHNIGFHYVDYVRLLGPLWAWSCFPFEDCNSMITKSVHGTGNITHQIMRLKEAQTVLRNRLQLTPKERLWKCTTCMLNCDVAGAINQIPNDAYKSFIMKSFCAEDISEIKKVERILLHGRKFYSQSYSRMKRRTCSVFITKSRKVVVVLYFVLHLKTELVYALVLPMHLKECGIRNVGKHFASVNIDQTCELILVEELEENVWYVDVKDDTFTDKFIVRMPNAHGHAIFK